MRYDPVKRQLGAVFNRSPFLRKVFYRLLDLLLLRAWHIHKELKIWARDKRERAIHIYDAGAGYGQYSYWLSGLSPQWRITAVDVKDEQVADCNAFFHAIGRPQVRFHVDDVTTYTDPGAFDLVVCVDVMEHILEDEAALRCYSTSLKAGGMLIISTPSDQGGSDVHDEGEGSFIEEHVRDGYNIDELKAKCLRNGFTRVEARYSYGTPGKISWRLSMKWPLLMLNTSKLFFIVIPFYYILAYPIAYVLNWIDTYGEHSTGTGLIVRAWK
ncbi:MAG: class I SAM-dependent methyltransferase [Flavobacteriales bacterium]|nr:class I SAM-dependent methyltransferase [Flavobacteriales bacterium]